MNPKVSVNILTKNRLELLKKALTSVMAQSFKDFEVVVINDGSSDQTKEFLFEISNTKNQISNKFKIINHQISKGITVSRQEALENSRGEYVAILDDDDSWADKDKLKKQVEFLENHPDYVLAGGGMEIIQNSEFRIQKFRPDTDKKIRQTMLFRNNFFTSTVMFRRELALKAGGFLKDDMDLAEDYDLWFRLGILGKMANFKQIFAEYLKPDYNIEKKKLFFKKQLILARRYRKSYPGFVLAKLFLQLRIFF